MKPTGPSGNLHRTARPHESLYEDQERTRRHIMVFRQGSILGPHHLPRIKNEDALARTFWTWELSTLKRASNAITATSVWRDVLCPFCFAPNLAPAQLISQSGCAATSSRTSSCFGWRNTEAKFQLYPLHTQSPRAACQREATTSGLYRLPAPGTSPRPHLFLAALSI